MIFLPWIFFILAAVLEVGGDAMIRRGLRGQGLISILIGFLLLGLYGMAVNMSRWDFSKLLGVYIGVFAIISILFGWLLFKEHIPLSTWLGLLLIISGGLVIQFGPRLLP